MCWPTFNKICVKSLICQLSDKASCDISERSEKEKDTKAHFKSCYIIPVTLDEPLLRLCFHYPNQNGISQAVHVLSCLWGCTY